LKLLDQWDIGTLDSKPSFNWLYGLSRTSDNFTDGATCLQAARGLI